MAKTRLLCGTLLTCSLLCANGASVLPTPPVGYTWNLVTTGTYDSIVVDASVVESAMEASLGLNGIDTTNISASSGLVSQTAAITAFDCGLAPAGQVFLITSNTYSASLSVTSSGYASGPAGSLAILSHSIGDVQVASSLGASMTDSGAATAGGSTGFVITPSVPTNSAIAGTMSQQNGEVVTFTFTATSELEVRGVPVPSEQIFGTLPAVDISLRRDTIYDTYELVVIPEPATSMLAVLGCSALFLRRRRS